MDGDEPAGRSRRAGAAHRDQLGGEGMVHAQLRVSRLSRPHRRSGAPRRDLRDGRAEAEIHGKNVFRRLGRHHGPDGAGGGLRRGEPQDEGCPHARRDLPDLRHEDLHHRRGQRPDGKHRPPGPGAHRGGSTGDGGHLHLPGPEIPGERRRDTGEEKRLHHRQHRAQNGTQGIGDLPDQLRRQRGLLRGAPRAGAPGHARHVSDDERGPHRCRPPGAVQRLHRVPPRPPVRQGAVPGLLAHEHEEPRGAAGSHHPAPRRPPDAPVDEGPGGRDARPDVLHRLVRRQGPHSNGGRRAGQVDGPPGSPHADLQGLLLRHGIPGHRTGDPGLRWIRLLPGVSRRAIHAGREDRFPV